VLPSLRQIEEVIPPGSHVLSLLPTREERILLSAVLIADT
jgi:hypothetical protein